MNTLLQEAREFSRLNDEQFQDIVQSTSSYEKVILNKIDNATNIEALWNIYENGIKFFEIYYEWMKNFRAVRSDLQKGANLIRCCKNELNLLKSIKNKYFTYNDIIRYDLDELDELKDQLISLKEGRHFYSLIDKVTEATNENLNISSAITLSILSFYKKRSKLVSYFSRIALGLLFFTFFVGGMLNLLENAYLYSILTAIVFLIQEFYISPKFNRYLFLRSKKFLKKGIKKFFNSFIIHEIYIIEEINEIEKFADEMKDCIRTNS